MSSIRKGLCIGVASTGLFSVGAVQAAIPDSYLGEFVSRCVTLDDAVYAVDGSPVNMRETFLFEAVPGSDTDVKVTITADHHQKADTLCQASPAVTTMGTAIFTFVDEVATNLPGYPVKVAAPKVDIVFDGFSILGSAAYNAQQDTYTINGVVFQAEDLQGGEFKQLIHTDSFFRFGLDDDEGPSDPQGYPVMLQTFDDYDVFARKPFPVSSQAAMDMADKYVGRFASECEWLDDALYNGQPVYVRETFDIEKLSDNSLSVVLNSYFYPGEFQYASCPTGQHSLQLTASGIEMMIAGQASRDLPDFDQSVVADLVMIGFPGYDNAPELAAGGVTELNGFVFENDFFDAGSMQSVFFANDDYWLMADDDELTDGQGYGLIFTDILRRMKPGEEPAAPSAYAFEGQYSGSCNLTSEVLLDDGRSVLSMENLHLVALDEQTLLASQLMQYYHPDGHCGYWNEPLSSISMTAAIVTIDGIQTAQLFWDDWVEAAQVSINHPGYDGFRYLQGSEDAFVELDGLQFSVELLTEMDTFKTLMYLDQSGTLFWGNDEGELNAAGYPIALNESDPLASIGLDDPFYVPVYQVEGLTSVSQGGVISPEVRYVYEGRDSEFFAYSTLPGMQVSNITGCGGKMTEKSAIFDGVEASFYTTGPITESCTVMAEFFKEKSSRRGGLPFWLFTLDQ